MIVAKDLRSKSASDLEKQLTKLREKQAKMRLEVVTKDTLKPSEFANIKKDIAVVLTVIREKQLAPKEAPKAKAGAKDA